MSGYNTRIAGIALCLVMLGTSAGCSDDPGSRAPDAGENIESGPDTGQPDTGQPDTGETDAGETDDDDLVLEGHLAPSGGMSMSSSFTLSGELTPKLPATDSSSANFVLEQTPPTLTVDESDE